ncbi:hypothetical protein [Ilumatobacter nonamiensis]|uniref:hypothetical protein n=1 Tax=Ilumatobacter nonamiensis TaxID=467093 RepID=UPI0011D29453|nr:hypothetical protein [Ilumatobacter nonamiensis]
MNIPSTSTVTKSVTGVVDSLPVERITSIDVPDLDDVLSDTSDFVVESAEVIGAQGTRAARAAWRNRRTVLTAIILALAVVGAVTLLKRRADSGDEPEIA